MPDPHPIELRERVVAAYESGEGSLDAIARRFAVPRSALQEWLAIKRKTGTVAPRERGGGNPSRVFLVTLERVIAERPDATTHEVAAEYNRRVHRSKRVHRSSIYRALTRAGYVFKKNGYVRESKTGPTSG